jgi:hypothetical protein
VSNSHIFYPGSSNKCTEDTIIVTASVSPSSSSSPSSGPSTAGIAAGVVVGIIAIGAIAGGVWFYIRAKRRREVEEEHKRQAAVTAFVNSGKPNSSAGLSHDTRLDPAIMTQRRMSDGSIADNQDYSRRILKVCIESNSFPSALTQVRLQTRDPSPNDGNHPPLHCPAFQPA